MSVLSIILVVFIYEICLSHSLLQYVFLSFFSLLPSCLHFCIYVNVFYLLMYMFPFCISWLVHSLFLHVYHSFAFLYICLGLCLSFIHLCVLHFTSYAFLHMQIRYFSQTHELWKNRQSKLHVQASCEKVKIIPGSRCVKPLGALGLLNATGTSQHPDPKYKPMQMGPLGWGIHQSMGGADDYRGLRQTKTVVRLQR